MSTEVSRSRKKQIGAFFTPLPLACEMIRAHGIHRMWAGGRSVFDPSAGNGALLEALILCCLEDGLKIDGSMLQRLKGCEREPGFAREFRMRIKERYAVTPPEETLICQDFLRRPADEFDLILGNPPWLNFTDLPEEEKEDYKSEFIRYGLTGRGKEILLGSARIDLAALFIQKALQNHLKDGGRAFFFIPLSLLFNEGAHNRFRRGNLNKGSFRFTEIRDFGQVRVFPEVSTRCGFTVIEKSASALYVPPEDGNREIPCFLLREDGGWIPKSASPVSGPGSAYAVNDGSSPPPRIKLPSSARPRQGINTGGRNSLFIFNSRMEIGKGLVKLENRERKVILPDSLVYPLITASQFKGCEEARRFIFLPYSREGKLLSREELTASPEAWSYLESCRASLLERKGSLLQSTMKKGWWALLGVGPYSFSSWKVVWEAYGRKEFAPRLFGLCEGKPWIPNQALQASCSFSSRKEAQRVLKELQHPGIGRHLKLQNMEGTCNWAQPGRIRRFMEFHDREDQ